MQTGEVLAFLREFAPPFLSESWDNTGLLIDMMHCPGLEVRCQSVRQFNNRNHLRLWIVFRGGLADWNNACAEKHANDGDRCQGRRVSWRTVGIC